MVSLYLTVLISTSILPQADTLFLKTGSPTGSYQAVGGAIATILEREISGLEIQLVGSSGSVENIQALASGEADLAIAQGDIAFFADRGREAFEGQPLRMTRAVLGLHTESVLILGRRSLGLLGVSGIKPGLRVVVGEARSGTIANARDVLGSLGLPLNLVDTLMRPPRNSLHLLATDSADIIFLTAGVTQEFLDEVALEGGEVLPLSEGLISILKENHPYYSSGETSARERGPSTLQIRSVLLVREGLDEDLVREITNVLLDNISELRSSHPRAQEILPGNVTQGIPILLHEGARKAYCERGQGHCDSRLGFIVLFLILAGVTFLTLFHGTSRRIFLRKAPRWITTHLVGPRGVTNRYMYLSVAVAVGVMLLAGAWFVQVSEGSFARSHNIPSDFEDIGLNENLVWMVVFTATGFEDGRFPQSPAGKLTSAAMNAIGIGGFLFLFVLISSDQLARKMKAKMRIDLKTVAGHTIVAGWNRRGPGLVKSLTDRALGPRQQTIVICGELDEDPFETHGLDDSVVGHSRGNPSDLKALRAAGLDTAKILIVLSDERLRLEDRDARTLLTIVNAEKYAYNQTLGPSPSRTRGIYTVVEVASPGNRDAMERVHADQVICIQEFDEELLVQSVLNPGLKPFLEEILKTDDDNEAIEVPVRGEKHPFVGLNFDDALKIGRNEGVLLVAIKRGGAEGWLKAQGRPYSEETDTTGLRRLLANPFRKEGRAYPIQPGDSLIFLAESEKPLAKFFKNPASWIGDLVG